MKNLMFNVHYMRRKETLLNSVEVNLIAELFCEMKMCKMKSEKKLNYFTTYFITCQSALGEGWDLSIVYTATELKFIYMTLAWRRGSPSFYLGGSSFATGPRDNIFYSEYLPNNKGKANKKDNFLSVLKSHHSNSISNFLIKFHGYFINTNC